MVTRGLAAVGVIALAFVAGFWLGTGRERDGWEARAAALSAARDRAAARAEGLAEALELERAARAELARQLEEAADADDDAGRIALPARSLQRIGAR